MKRGGSINLVCAATPFASCELMKSPNTSLSVNSSFLAFFNLVFPINLVRLPSQFFYGKVSAQAIQRRNSKTPENTAFSGVWWRLMGSPVCGRAGSAGKRAAGTFSNTPPFEPIFQQSRGFLHVESTPMKMCCARMKPLAALTVKYCG